MIKITTFDETSKALVTLIDNLHGDYATLKTQVTPAKAVTDKDLVEYVKEHNAKAFAAWNKALEAARTALTPKPAANMDEAKAKFKTVKSRLMSTLDALEGHAEYMKKDSTIVDVKTVRDSLKSSPVSTNSNGRTESQEIRAWAAEQDIKINPKGRIPTEVVEKYRAAQ